LNFEFGPFFSQGIWFKEIGLEGISFQFGRFKGWGRKEGWEGQTTFLTFLLRNWNLLRGKKKLWTKKKEFWRIIWNKAKGKSSKLIS